MKTYHTACLALLAVSIGCSRGANYDSTVEGSVTVDGQLATRGRVTFHPVKSGPPAYGSIFQNGSYSLRVGQGDLSDVDGGQLHSGEYLVTVVVNMPSVKDESMGDGGPPRPGAHLMAAKYADPATTNLRFIVKPGRNVIPLELEGVEEVVETEDATASDEAAADDSATESATDEQAPATDAAPAETPSETSPAQDAPTEPAAEAPAEPAASGPTEQPAAPPAEETQP